MGIMENIVELQKRERLTQEELSKIAGVSRGEVVDKCSIVSHSAP